MNTKNNRRYKETTRKLSAAMLDLMKYTEFDRITVRKICENAHVNHSTFYAHFRDIYDLIGHMEQSLQERLLQIYKETPAPSSGVLSAEIFIPFLEHVYEHKYFYRINLLNRKVLPLSQGCEMLWKMNIVPFILRKKKIPEDQLPYNYTYFQAGFIMLLQKWVDKGCKEPIEEFAEIIISCVSI
ncbi:TetR/AcrR family transcriptional regulator [bacterium 210820-DFI.6.37]|nr:TetR/AcrR family transcriptional regulator [bacterium 210820-DFI.6.37]